MEKINCGKQIKWQKQALLLYNKEFGWFVKEATF